MLIQRPITASTALRIGGAFASVFSVAAGMLVFFVGLAAYSFVSGLQLVFLGFFFIIGVLALLIGLALSPRKVR